MIFKADNLGLEFTYGQTMRDPLTCDRKLFVSRGWGGGARKAKHSEEMMYEGVG